MHASFRKISSIAASIALVAAIGGCSAGHVAGPASDALSGAALSTIEDVLGTAKSALSGASSSADGQPAASATSDADGTATTARHVEWNEQDYPDYYRVIDQSVDIDYGVERGQISYGTPDALGRSTRAVANVTKDMVDASAGWRAKIDGNPAGWPTGKDGFKNVKVKEGGSAVQMVGYSGWAFNRSHLVADSLGGYEAAYDASGSLDHDASVSKPYNLVTALATENVGSSGHGGMAYIENAVADFLNANPQCSIWYSVTPYYASASDLLPTSVFVDVRSCNGELQESVEIYDSMDGYTLDYATGALTDDATGKVVNEA